MAIFKARFVAVILNLKRLDKMNVLLNLHSVKEFEDIFAQDVIEIKQLRQHTFNGYYKVGRYWNYNY